MKLKINKERIIASFINLVKINSESGEEKEIISYLDKKLMKLGFKTRTDKIGNLIASNSNKPILALAAHVDVVQPGKNIKVIISKTGLIKTDGKTILGGDDKSGVAAILEVVETLKENNTFIPLEIIFTVSEEIGLLGSSSLDFKKIKSKQALNLDAKPGDIIVGEPANMYFDITIKGRAAHAGVHPEKGISAIQIAAEAISKLKWGKLDSKSTANVGTITGGNARNTVPAEVLLKAEVRSKDKSLFKKHCQKIVSGFKKAAKKYKGNVVVKQTQTGWVFKIDEKDKLVKAVYNACEENRIKPRVFVMAGNSDADIFNKNGIKTISVGAMGKDIHTTIESITKRDLEKGAQIILDSVIDLQTQK